MTNEQKTAYVLAQIEFMRAERELMISENVERERLGQAQANGPEQWEMFISKWDLVLGHNAVTGMFRD